MTNDEKEIFLAKSLENKKNLSSGYYAVRWVLYFDKITGLTTLYEDTEYKKNNDMVSRDSNYSLTKYWSDRNGLIPWVKHFDVSFLFEKGFKSHFGCVSNNLSNSLSLFVGAVKNNIQYYDFYVGDFYNNNYYLILDLSTSKYYAITPIRNGMAWYEQNQSLASTYNYNDAKEELFNLYSLEKDIVDIRRVWFEKVYVPCIVNRFNRCCLEYC